MIPGGDVLAGDRGGELLPIHRFDLGLTSKARGGVAINDGSAGINVKDWAGRSAGGLLYLSAPDVPEFVYASTPSATSVTFAFDRNMAPSVAWNTPDGLFFRWFDASLASFTTSEFPDARNAMVIHDDVRDLAEARSDVLLVYQRGAGLYYRQQRDRYLTEYLLQTPVFGALKRCGMGSGLRILWTLIDD